MAQDGSRISVRQSHKRPITPPPDLVRTDMNKHAQTPARSGVF